MSTVKIDTISAENPQEYLAPFQLTIVNSLIYSPSHIMYVLASCYFKKLDYVSVILQMCQMIKFPIFNIINTMVPMIFVFKVLSFMFFFLMPKILIEENSSFAEGLSKDKFMCFRNT